MPQAGRSGDWIPVGVKYSVVSRLALKPTQCIVHWGMGFAGLRIGWSLPLPPLSACIGMSWGDLCLRDFKFLLDSLPLKMELIGCPEMPVRNYHYLLHNNPEECSSLLTFTCYSLMQNMILLNAQFSKSFFSILLLLRKGSVCWWCSAS
jgi:hypothetical protein